jgi:hypothetical protein
MHMSTPVPVTLVFEGVLVGRYDKATKTYEMGVLPVPSHSFNVTIEEHGPVSAEGNERPLINSRDMLFNKVEITPDEAQWLLEIEGSAPSASLFLPDATPPDRTIPPEDPFGKLDYRWVIDLENEFPNHSPDPNTTRLPRHGGLLKPVLNITMGEFYATDVFILSPVSSRQGSNGAFQDFGFVPQQVAAEFTLDPGKNVVLKKIDSGEEVFRINPQESYGYTITFRNTPPDDKGPASGRLEDTLSTFDINRPTHFQLLYLLFNVPPPNRYDLRIVPTPAAPTFAALSIGAMFAEEDSGGVGVPTLRCAPINGGG